jgi:PBSX family phage terminase large subunit
MPITQDNTNKVSLHPAQAEIANDMHRFRVVNCGRRFGKTVLAIYEMVGKASFTRDGKIAYIAPTYQQARDICWNQLKKIVAPITKSVNEARLEINVYNDTDNFPQYKNHENKTKNFSTIFLRGWEAVETLRGQYFDFLVIDEVASMKNFWTGWNEVLQPTLTDKSGEVLFLSTPKGFNHFYDLYNQEHKSPDYKSFHFTSYDNIHLQKKEIEAIRANTPVDAFEQEYMAEFKKMQGLVYPEFSREKHLINQEELDKLEKKEWAEVMCGVDFGYTNPSAIIVIKRDTDNTFWITEEWYKTKQTTAQIIEKVKQFNPYTVYPDPAEPDRIEEMKNANMNVREVNKDIVAGIDRVRELLKQNRLKIHPLCSNLILEMETYHYPDDTFGKNPYEKPVKENDHAMDAMRYVLFSNSLDPVDQNLVDKFKLYTTTYE